MSPVRVKEHALSKKAGFGRWLVGRFGRGGVDIVASLLLSCRKATFASMSITPVSHGSSGSTEYPKRAACAKYMAVSSAVGGAEIVVALADDLAAALAEWQLAVL